MNLKKGPNIKMKQQEINIIKHKEKGDVTVLFINSKQLNKNYKK